MKTVTKLTFIALTTALSAGCASLSNGPETALSYEQEHPIAVDTQVVTMTISVDETTGALSALDEARLRAFAMSYMNDGHGLISLTTPSRNSDASQKVASAIREKLHASGIDNGAMGSATYVPGKSSDGNLIVSYTQYVATPSACGISQGTRERDYRNLRTPNFGCSTQNNLAAMIGDPRDLIMPADMTSPDAAIRIRGVRLYREGVDTSTDRGDIEASTGQ